MTINLLIEKVNIREFYLVVNSLNVKNNIIIV